MINIVIPTHKRSKTILNDTLDIIKDFNKDKFNIYIFANPLNELPKYEFLSIDNIKVVWVDTKWILTTRNAILDYFKEWEKIFFIDDDVTGVVLWYIEDNKKINKKLTNKQIEQVILKWFLDINKQEYKIFWFYPIPNYFFMSKKITNNQFIIASAFGIIKTKLKFDKNLSLKEDYDFTLQNYIQYGWGLRYNYISFKAKHYTNKWGCQTERTDEREKESCNYLLQKWSELVRLNPKRENEILLNIK